jgi:hypothetical protein
MTMKDWAEHLDKILTMSGEKLLQGQVQSVTKPRLRRQQPNIRNISKKH